MLKAYLYSVAILWIVLGISQLSYVLYNSHSLSVFAHFLFGSGSGVAIGEGLSHLHELLTNKTYKSIYKGW
jgi:hypothetical protein